MSSVTAKPNEQILLAEDGEVFKHTKENWAFRPFYYFKDSRNGQQQRPKVDVSTPYNPHDETHAARKFGQINGFFMVNSLAHFAASYDEAPFTQTYSSWDACSIFWALTQVGVLQGSLNQWHKGQIDFFNPRTRFAHRIVFMASLLRANMYWAITCPGYFYSYELLYTYVPGFKIADPSCNGWKQCWKDDQTTFRARIAAAVFPAIGHAFYCGTPAHTATLFTYYAALSCWYEFCRVTVFTGQSKYFTNRAAVQANKLSKYGDLQPNMHHTVDSDTMRPDKATMFRFMRQGSGMMSEHMQTVAHEDERPMVRTLNLVPNPYFNWQKAKQGYNEKPFEYKNDTWEMPRVMNAKVRSGAMDEKPLY